MKCVFILRGRRSELNRNAGFRQPHSPHRFCTVNLFISQRACETFHICIFNFTFNPPGFKDDMQKAKAVTERDTHTEGLDKKLSQW